MLEDETDYYDYDSQANCGNEALTALIPPLIAFKFFRTLLTTPRTVQSDSWIIFIFDWWCFSTATTWTIIANFTLSSITTLYNSKCMHTTVAFSTPTFPLATSQTKISPLACFLPEIIAVLKVTFEWRVSTRLHLLRQANCLNHNDILPLLLEHFMMLHNTHGLRLLTNSWILYRCNVVLLLLVIHLISS